MSLFMQILLHPVTWVAALLVWALLGAPDRQPRRHADRKNLPPGSFTKTGSSKTSKTEMQVRNFVKSCGYKIMDQGTGLIVHGREASGRRRQLTPDVIVYGPRSSRFIVEVDPYYTHAQAGLSAVYEDMDRNVEYTKLKYPVIRLRIGFDKTPAEGFARLSPNDVVITQAEFNNGAYKPLLRGAMRSAKALPPSTWDEKMNLLRPYHIHAKRNG